MVTASRQGWKAAAAAAVALWFLLGLRAFLPQARGLFGMYYVDLGEALLHGLAPAGAISERMPIGPLLEALGVMHSAPWALQSGVALLLAACLLLVFALGRELGGFWTGLCAAALWQRLFFSLPNGPGFYKHAGFTFFVLLAAGLTVRRAAKPSLAGSLRLACALGAGLLYRSTLVLFPPLLVAYELAFLYRRRARKPWAQWALLGLVPYLFLAPWTAMNHELTGRFIPLENGAANMDLATGALGTVTAAHGDVRLLAGEAAAENRFLLGWAVKETLRHPARFCRAFALRLARYASLQPLAFLLGLLAFAWFRKEERFRQLALLCGYFTFVYCCMTSEDHYFLPLWPMLLAAGSALFFFPASEAPARQGRAPALASGLALALLAALASTALVAAYPARSRRPVTRILERPGEDAWLLYERGRRSQGTAAGERDLRAALDLQPDLPRLRLELAWAELEKGNAAPLLEGVFTRYPAQDAFNDDLKEKACVYRALALLRAGRVPPARQELEAALHRHREAKTLLFREPGELDAHEREVVAALRKESDESFLELLTSLLAHKPRARAQVVRELARMRPGSAKMWLADAELSFELDDAAELGAALAAAERLAAAEPALRKTVDEARQTLSRRAYEAAASRGDRAQALSALRLAEIAGAGQAEVLLAVAHLYRRLDAPKRALSLLEGLTRRDPAHLEAWLEQAQAAAAADARQPGAARAALARARALLEPELSAGPLAGEPLERLLRVAGLHRALKDHARAADLLRRALRAAPLEARLWLELAEVLLESGDRAGAQGALKKADEHAGGEERVLHALSLLYQETAQLPRALALLGRLTSQAPANAVYFKDRGIAQYKSGASDQAVLSLREALRLDPGHVEAALSLGAVYSAQRRPAEALAVYEAALSRPSPPGPMRDLLLKSRGEAEARLR